MDDSEALIKKLLSTPNFKDIVLDEQKLVDFINHNSKYVQFLEDRNKAMAQNCYHIACCNIQHKQDFEAKKQKVESLCNEIKDLGEQLDNLIDLKGYYQNKISFDSIIDSVQQEIGTLENKSEEILRQFYNQKIGTDELYETFIQVKAAYYKLHLSLKLLWQSFAD